MNLVKNKILRTSIFIFGCLSLFLGFIGIFLPLLPTTPFILLTAWCFLKSSEKAHNWLNQHSILGPILSDWKNHKAISQKTKYIAVIMILISSYLIIKKVNFTLIKYSVLLLLAFISVFIITRKNR